MREESADVQTQAEEKRRALFGEESSCIVVINKAYQRLSIQSRGQLAKVITSARAGRIAARGSTDLTRGQTYNAVSEAFSQLGTTDRQFENSRSPESVLQSLSLSDDRIDSDECFRARSKKARRPCLNEGLYGVGVSSLA